LLLFVEDSAMVVEVLQYLLDLRCVAVPLFRTPHLMSHIALSPCSSTASGVNCTGNITSRGRDLVSKLLDADWRSGRRRALGSPSLLPIQPSNLRHLFAKHATAA